MPSAISLRASILTSCLLFGVPGLAAEPANTDAKRSAPAAKPAAEVKLAAPPAGLHFISTAFENASPLWWEADADGAIHIHLSYDQERDSPNRANGHWLFRIDAEPGTELTLLLEPLANVWNGRLTRPEARVSFVSDDGQTWRPTDVEPVDAQRLRLRVRMVGPQLYVARLQPYRISDLDKFKAEIAKHGLVEIQPVGRTVEGRELEIIRVGRPDAPHGVLLRARAHPWEPGGNWVMEGLVRRLLRDDDASRRCLAQYCLYLMPMTNKDGVARGGTRFNLQGMDLNRKWDVPADPQLAPEKAALEKWLDAMAAQHRTPELAIDFHNDCGGHLHISRPDLPAPQLQAYLARTERLEALLRAHTWFTEGSTKSSFRNPGTFGEGLLTRWGITAVIHELNANRIAGLNDYPTAAHWIEYGEKLSEVFRLYFQDAK